MIEARLNQQVFVGQLQVNNIEQWGKTISDGSKLTKIYPSLLFKVPYSFLGISAQDNEARYHSWFVDSTNTIVLRSLKADGAGIPNGKYVTWLLINS